MRVEDALGTMVGRSVQRIWMTEEYLVFRMNDGQDVAFTVYGDCCSHSYLWDFLGVRNLLDNGPIIQVAEIVMPEVPESEELGCTRWYGYRFTTEHPLFGEVSSVLSFRNDSNGYYGGEMESIDVGHVEMSTFQHELTEDCLGTA